MNPPVRHVAGIIVVWQVLRPVVIYSVRMTDTSATALPACPECGSEFTYEMPPLFACPECGHEWPQEAAPEEEFLITDAVGNILSEGDSVTITTTVKVKGASQPLKAGTKVRGIRLNPDKGTGPHDHCIDCKIDGFGAMSLKPAVVKKA